MSIKIKYTLYLIFTYKVIIVIYKGFYAMFFLIYCLYYIHLTWWASLIELFINKRQNFPNPYLDAALMICDEYNLYCH